MVTVRGIADPVGSRFLDEAECSRLGALLRQTFDKPANGSFLSLLARIDERDDGAAAVSGRAFPAGG